MDKVNFILAQLRLVLTGEPLRAVSYGAVALVGAISFGLVQTGVWADMPSLVGIEAAVAASVAAVTEIGRRYVYSPNTVEVIVAGTPTSSDPAGGMAVDEPAAPDPTTL